MQRLRIYYLDQQLVALVACGKKIPSTEKFDFDAQSRDLYDTKAPHNKLSDFDPLVAAFEKNELFPIAGIDPALAASFERFTKLQKE